MPRRAKTGGSTPGITGQETAGPKKESDQWIYRNLEPSQHELKTPLTACICVAVKEVFRCHVYTFGGRLFQQQVGGAIGLRLTSVAAKIRMAR